VYIINDSTTYLKIRDDNMKKRNEGGMFSEVWGVSTNNPEESTDSNFKVPVYLNRSCHIPEDNK
jgi:hypothetical protein